MTSFLTQDPTTETISQLHAHWQSTQTSSKPDDKQSHQNSTVYPVIDPPLSSANRFAPMDCNNAMPTHPSFPVTEVKLEKTGSSTFECAFIRNSFICSCNYSVPASEPDFFCNHLWEELHPYGPCTHDPKDEENECKKVNQMMAGLLSLKAKARNSEKKSTEVKIDRQIKCEISASSHESRQSSDVSKDKALDRKQSSTGIEKNCERDQFHTSNTEKLGLDQACSNVTNSAISDQHRELQKEVASNVTSSFPIIVLQALENCLPATCSKCSFTSVLKTIHEQLHRVKRDVAKWFWCPHCPFSCNSLLHFRIHSLCHSENKKTCKLKLYHCSYCDVVVNQTEMIENHIEDKHGDLPLKYETTKLDLHNSKCADCDTKLVTEMAYLEHLEESHTHSHFKKYFSDMYAITNVTIVQDETVPEEDIDQIVLRPNISDEQSGYIFVIINKNEDQSHSNDPDNDFQECYEYDCVSESMNKCHPKKCQKCSFTAEFGIISAIHQPVHSTGQDTKRRFWCMYCPHSCDTLPHFKLHACHHAENLHRSRIHNCGHCDFSTNKVDIIDNHHEHEHHNLSLKYETTQLFLTDIPCTECETLFPDEVSLWEHLQSGRQANCSLRRYLKDMYHIVGIGFLQENEEEERNENQAGGHHVVNKYILLEVGKDEEMILESKEVEEMSTKEHSDTSSLKETVECHLHIHKEVSDEVLPIRGKTAGGKTSDTVENNTEENNEITAKDRLTTRIINENYASTKGDDSRKVLPWSNPSIAQVQLTEDNPPEAEHFKDRNISAEKEGSVEFEQPTSFQSADKCSSRYEGIESSGPRPLSDLCVAPVEELPETRNNQQEYEISKDKPDEKEESEAIDRPKTLKFINETNTPTTSEKLRKLLLKPRVAPEKELQITGDIPLGTQSSEDKSNSLEKENMVINDGLTPWRSVNELSCHNKSNDGRRLLAYANQTACEELQETRHNTKEDQMREDKGMSDDKEESAATDGSTTPRLVDESKHDNLKRVIPFSTQTVVPGDGVGIDIPRRSTQAPKSGNAVTHGDDKKQVRILLQCFALSLE